MSFNLSKNQIVKKSKLLLTLVLVWAVHIVMHIALTRHVVRGEN